MSKRTRVQSPKKVDEAGPALKPKEQIDLLLNGMTATHASTSELLTTVITNSALIRTGGLSVVDANPFPEHYLPPSFTRQQLSDGSRAIVYQGKYKLDRKRRLALKASILTTATGAKEYWIDSDGLVLIQARSSATATAVYFENSKSNITKGDDPYPLLTFIRDLVPKGSVPKAEQLSKLLGKVRGIHKAKKSAATLEALKALVTTNGAAHGLTEGLNSTKAEIPVLCSLILGVLMSEEVLDSVLASACAGDIQVDLLYRILRATDFAMPVRTFTSNQGLDVRGAPLEAVKLSECDRDSSVIVESKVTTAQYFKTLSGDTLVYVEPGDGVFRKDGMRDKRMRYKEMKVSTTEVETLLKIAAAVRGTSAPQIGEEEEESKEMELQDLVELSESESE